MGRVCLQERKAIDKAPQRRVHEDEQADINELVFVEAARQGKQLLERVDLDSFVLVQTLRDK